MSSSITVHASAVDSSGNVYITGSYHGRVSLGTATQISDISGSTFVARFDTSGKLTWFTQIKSDSSSSSNDIAVSSNAVYLVGTYTGQSTLGSLTLPAPPATQAGFLAKLDLQGTWLSAQKVMDLRESALSVGVDSNGDVYLAGKCKETLTLGSDNRLQTAGVATVNHFVAKLNPQGIYQWVTAPTLIQGSNSLFDMAVSAQGNVYLTGLFTKGSMSWGQTTLSSASSGNTFVYQLNTQGALQWVQSLQGDNIGRRIAVDSNNNAFVAGSFYGVLNAGTLTATGPARNPSLYLTKFNNQGQIQWLQSVKSSSTLQVRGVTTDGQGNAYLSGSFYYDVTLGQTKIQTPRGGSFVTKYDSQGTLGWNNHSENSLFPTQSVFGNLHALSNNTLLFTGALNQSSKVGAQTLSNKGGDTLIWGTLDTQGKLTSSYQLESAKPGHMYSQFAQTDSNGNIYVAGQYTGTATLGSVTLSGTTSSLFVAKLSPQGTWLWAKPITSTGFAYMHGLAVDPQGNVYVAGIYHQDLTVGSLSIPNAGSASFDVYVAKLNTQGQAQWVKEIQGSGVESVRDLHLNGTNQPCLLVEFSKTLMAGTFSLNETPTKSLAYSQWDSAGKPTLLKTLIRNTSSLHGITKATYDSNDNLYLTGGFVGTTTFGTTTMTSQGNMDLFVGKYSKDGTLQWVRPLGATGDEFPISIAVGPQNSVLIASIYTTPLTVGTVALPAPVQGGIHLFVAEMDSSGQWKQASYVGGTDGQLRNGTLLRSSTNQLYLQVPVSGAFFFPGTTMDSLPGTRPGNVKTLIMKLNGSLQQTSYQTFVSPAIAVPMTMAIDTDDNLIHTGIFVATMTFNSLILSSSQITGFVGKQPAF